MKPEFALEHWDSVEYAKLKETLHSLEDKEYLAFHSRLITTRYPLRGVRLPELRRLAKAVARGNWREFLTVCKTDTYEEVMLHGMLLGVAKCGLEELLEHLAVFVPLIDNWAVCDSVCIAIKAARQDRERVWAFLQPYLASVEEFELRFAVVMLLDHFVTDKYLEQVLAVFDEIRHDGYYVKMAVAWAVSVCFAYYPVRTMEFLRQDHMDGFTHNKAIQKCIESYRVCAEDKQALRELKRK